MPVTLTYHVPNGGLSLALAQAFMENILNFSEDPPGESRTVAEFLGLSPGRLPVSVTPVVLDDGRVSFDVVVSLNTTPTFAQNFSTPAAQLAATRNLYTARLQAITGGPVTAEEPVFPPP